MPTRKAIRDKVVVSVFSDPKWNGLILCTFSALLVMPSFIHVVYELKLVTQLAGKNVGRITLFLSSYLSSLCTAGHFKEIEL